MKYKITVLNANQYMMGFLVGSNKGLHGPCEEKESGNCVFHVNETHHNIITNFLNKFDMDGMRYTVEIL